MRAFGVVVDAPFLDDHLRLFEAVEEFAVEASAMPISLPPGARCGEIHN